MLARHQELLGDGGGKQAGQSLRSCRGGEQAEAHLRHSEPGTFAGDAQVAGESEFEPAAERQPIDGRDARLGEARQPAEAVGERVNEAGEVVGRVEAIELGDVGTGGEGAALTGHHDDPHAGVGLDGVERLVEQGDGVGADGVQPPGAIESEDRDTVVDGEPEDRTVRHAIVSPPLTDSVWPVMYDASSLARNATAGAMSSG